MPIDDAFDRTAEYYDAWVRQAIPCYDELFATALAVIPFPPERAIRVLDLGAGTGLFSRHVLGRYPQARFVLWDLAEKMLEMAREACADRAERFEFVADDYRKIAYAEEFDLVVSSLSIHHLEHGEKRALFERVHGALAPGGLFLNIDQIHGETEALRELYWSTWLDKVRRSGADEERIQESIVRRRTYDRDATLAQQIEWLREAGFAQVDCIYKSYFMGLFFARKA